MDSYRTCTTYRTLALYNGQCGYVGEHNSPTYPILERGPRLRLGVGVCMEGQGLTWVHPRVYAAVWQPRCLPLPWHLGFWGLAKERWVST
jgi:hypothetical protein